MKTLKDMENEIATSAKEVNDNRQKLEDARDVDKAFDEWVKITPDEKSSDWPRLTKAFATYYAQRCGVELGGECEHPYHSVVGGGGKPER